MTIEVDGWRQPRLSPDSRFRHVVRSHYAYQLDSDRVKDLAEKLMEVSSWFFEDCEQFCQSLQ